MERDMEEVLQSQNTMLQRLGKSSVANEQAADISKVYREQERHAWPFVTLPSALKWPNLDHRTVCCTGVANSGIMPPMKYWEIIADKFGGAGSH